MSQFGGFGNIATGQAPGGFGAPPPTPSSSSSTSFFNAPQQQQQPLFGAPSATTSPFGNPNAGKTTASGGLFSTNNNSAAAASTPFGFGSSASTSSSQQPLSFGMAGQQQQQGPFGTAATTAPSFGTTGTTPSFGTSSTTPSFGTTATTPSFGTSPTPSFGATTPSFGTTAPSFGTTAPSFGSTATTTPSFGTTPTATPSFGATSTATPSFGATSTTTPAPFGGIGTTPTAPLSFGSTTAGFGGTPSSTAALPPTTFGFGGGGMNPSTNNAPSGMVFGASSNLSAATNTTTPFGGSAGVAPFGFSGSATNNTTSVAAGFPSPFSSSQGVVAPPSSGFAFGQQAAPPQAQPNAGFSFGQSSSQMGAPNNNAVFSNATNTPKPNFGFGGGSAAAPAPFSTPFGSSAPAPATATPFSSLATRQDDTMDDTQGGTSGGMTFGSSSNIAPKSPPKSMETHSPIPPDSKEVSMSPIPPDGGHSPTPPSLPAPTTTTDDDTNTNTNINTNISDEEKLAALKAKIEHKRKLLQAQKAKTAMTALAEKNKERFGTTATLDSTTAALPDLPPELQPLVSRITSENTTSPPLDVEPDDDDDIDPIQTMSRNLIGTCPHMCPDDELVRRRLENDVQAMEVPQKGFHPEGWTLRETMVKRFRRSAADFKLDVPSLVRPPEVLERVCGYLEEWVMERDRQSHSPPLPLDLYQFIWDRTRMIRKDFILQNYTGTSGLCSATATRCHERIARWHALCEHQLSHIEEYVVGQRQQNIQELGQTMKTLNLYYDDVEGRSGVGDGGKMGCESDVVQGGDIRGYDGSLLLNERGSFRVISSSPLSGTAEPEMRGLYILLTLDNDGGMEVLKYAGRLCVTQPTVFASPPVQLALEIYKTKKTHNYAKFFSILKSPSTPYLFGCLMFGYVEFMRKCAFRIMSKSYGGRRRDNGKAMYDSYPLKTLVGLLCFEDEEEAEGACRHFGIVVKDMVLEEGRGMEKVVLWRHADFKEPTDPEKGTVIPLRPRKMVRTIEAKLNGATRLAICRGDVSGGEGSILKTPPLRRTSSLPQPLPQRSNAEPTKEEQQTTIDTADDQKRKEEEVKAAAAAAAAAEEAQRQREDEEEYQHQLRLQQEEEDAKRRALEEQAAAAAAAEERLRQKQIEAERLRQEKERQRKLKEEERQQRIKEEMERREREAKEAAAAAEKRRRLKEEEDKKRAEEERQRRLQEEERKRRKEEEERQRQIELQRQKAAQDAAEAERLRLEAEKQRHAKEAAAAAAKAERLRLEQEQERRRIAREWEGKMTYARKKYMIKLWRRRVVEKKRGIWESKKSLGRLSSSRKDESERIVEWSKRYHNARNRRVGEEEDGEIRFDYLRFEAQRRSKWNPSALMEETLLTMTTVPRRRRRENHFVILSKLAIVVPPSLLCNDELQSWLKSIFPINDVAIKEFDKDGVGGMTGDIRTVTIVTGSMEDCHNVDMVLFLLFPTDNDEEHLRHLDDATSYLKEDVVAMALILDDNANRNDQWERQMIDHWNSSSTTSLPPPTVTTVSRRPENASQTNDAVLSCGTSLARRFIQGNFSEEESFYAVERISLLSVARRTLQYSRRVENHLRRRGGSRLLHSSRGRMNDNRKKNNNNKNPIDDAAEILQKFIRELVLLGSRIQRSPLGHWPAPEFAGETSTTSTNNDDKKRLIPLYFPDDGSLPLKWYQGLLSEDTLKKRLAIYFPFVEGYAIRFETVMEEMLDNMAAPLRVVRKCMDGMREGRWDEVWEGVLRWLEEIENEGSGGWEEEEGCYIYLPKEEFKYVVHRTMERHYGKVVSKAYLEDMETYWNGGYFEDDIIIGSADTPSEEQQHGVTRSNDGKFSMNDDNESSNKTTNPTKAKPIDVDDDSSSIINTTITKRPIFILEDDSDHHTSGKDYNNDADDDVIPPTSKRSKSAAVSHEKELSRDVEESREFTRRLESLLHGDETIDLMIGNNTLASILANTKKINAPDELFDI